MSCPSRAAVTAHIAAVTALVATIACSQTRKPAAFPPARPTPGRSAVIHLQHDIDTILGDPALERGYWGVLVKSLKTGETLYSRNARKLMMPASNMKIVTLAAAAERLGWDYTYETKLLARGPTENGTLDGDLIVVGSGDPSFTAADGMAEAVFAEWAERLKQLGIRRITGHLVGDDNALEDQTLGFGWSWTDLPDDYAAGVGALQFNENRVHLTVSPGPKIGDAAAVAFEPAGSGLTIVNSVTTGTPASVPSIAAERLPGSSRLRLGGTIPLDSAPISTGVAVDNPTLFFVNVLRAALIAHGIDVPAAAIDIDDMVDRRGGPQVPSPLTVVSTTRSAPLSTLAVRLMKASQNQYAETLLKTVGAATGAPTAAGGRAATQATLETWGLSGSALIQRDGSGLSRYDYVTPDALVAILAHVHAVEELGGPFQAALPVAGRDGTLANRMKGTAAEGNARAKTGSMSNVRSLSGYVTSAGGEPLVFALIANNFETPPDRVVGSIDAIVVRLAQFSR